MVLPLTEEFIISECKICKKINWPPLKFCKRCLNENSFRRGSKKGKIIEFSKNHSGYFGIVEFEGQIRVIGNLGQINKPEINQDVILKKIKRNNSEYSFEISTS